jgi:hypothetical protein
MDLSERRVALSLFQLLALGIFGLLGLAVLSTDAYAGVVTTNSLLSTAKSAIAAQTGAHVVSMASSASSSSGEKIIADVGVTSGMEVISQGKAKLSVKVTTTGAYVSGNSSGLTTIFGFSAAEANKVGSDWVFWKTGTSQYSNLKSDVTISSVLEVLPKAKGTKLSTRTVGGTKVYDLKWTTAATSSLPKLSNTLTISTNGSTLPTDEASAASDGAKVTTVFSKWGEHVLVSTPPASSTVAVARITG